ncbi:MAG: RNA polymerase sigma factor [Jatrophihabitans sp.]|uniref:RNA polymerase sigma factor n=1 Tax=Jatrophihabitans sp. TaxID=1932789 RepID=UPI003F7DB300
MNTVRDAPAEPTAAVEELFRRHGAMLVRLATFLCGDRGAAEEIVQESFAAVIRHWRRLVDHQAALAYVRAAVVNGTRNHHRRAGVARRHLRVAEPEATADVADTLLLAEEHRAVLLALRDLPPRQREVLVLRYWSDLDEGEIAAAMGIARGTVKSTAARALDAIERRLKELHA